MERYRYWAFVGSGVALVAACWVGVLQPIIDGSRSGTRQTPTPDGSSSGSLALERKESRGSSSAAQRSGQAEASTQIASADCGSGYRATGPGRCEPLQANGLPYGPEQMAKYAKMTQSPLVSKANFLVPRAQSLDELRAHRQLLERINHLAEKIRARRASEDEINEHFNFRERLTSYRLQILSYIYVESGGTLNSKDYDLAQETISDPLLQDYHRRIVAEGYGDFLSRKKARTDNGLPEEERADWKGAEL